MICCEKEAGEFPFLSQKMLLREKPSQGLLIAAQALDRVICAIVYPPERH